MDAAAPVHTDRILPDIPALAETAGLLENLALDSQTKTTEVPEPAKKNPTGRYRSGNSANTSYRPLSRSATPVHVDHSAYYIANGYSPNHYYGGYDGHGSEWNSGFVNGDPLDISHGGTVMYPQGYGFSPFGSYPADSTVSGTGDYAAQQHYQYPNGFYQTQTSTGNVPNLSQEAPNSATSEKVPPSVAAAAVKTPNVANSGNINRITVPKAQKPSNQNASSNSNGSYKKGSSQTGYPSSGYQDPRYGYDGYQSPVPFLDMSMYANGPSGATTGSGFSSTGNAHPTRPGQAGFMSIMYPSRMYSQYGNRARPGFGAFNYNAWANVRGWTSGDNKYKYRGRGYGNENADGLTELNRGPRSKVLKNQNDLGPATQTVERQTQQLSDNNSEDTSSQILDMAQFNKEDFPEDYSDAKFFVIKSYSEDDVHKSIKYGVWTSTLNGNKKLDAAYQKAKENPGGCRVFLLFSVNTSGQFVGLAEMVGPVEFNKSVEYWQQEKWVGYFPVKWHIVKDVPNSSLRHLTLENNENKPVTNSRDTQEVYLEQGVQIIKIFKSHKGKTSILDDFGFYAVRERKMQEKKAKQKIQKQVDDAKDGEFESTKEKEKTASTATEKENYPLSLDAASNNAATAATEVA